LREERDGERRGFLLPQTTSSPHPSPPAKSAGREGALRFTTEEVGQLAMTTGL